MAASNERWRSLTDILGQVRTGWPTGIWLWDERLECAVAAVSKAQEVTVRAVVTAALPLVWTATTLDQAPDSVRTVARYSGGLRGGQDILAIELPSVQAGAFAYCLWWPWSTGTTASARISATGVSGGEDDIESLLRSTLAIK